MHEPCMANYTLVAINSLYFAFKYLKQTFKKSHLKLIP